MKKKTIMKIQIILIILIFIILIYLFSHEFDLQNSTSLAREQQSLFEKYKSGENVSKAEMQKLENNLWVKTAYYLAPGNLVVRQYVLIDLLNNNTDDEDKIIYQINKIGNHENKSECIWLEGYSYWLYTKPFLQEYETKYNSKYFSDFIDCIDNSFVKTSYLRNDLLYPVPFGDLRNDLLEADFQNKTSDLQIIVGPVAKNNSIYIIKSSPLGLNTHASKKDSKIFIINGTPYYDEQGNQEFKWYASYKEKYNNSTIKELMDLFDVRRVVSLIK
jgi:hypothetical protein